MLKVCPDKEDISCETLSLTSERRALRPLHCTFFECFPTTHWYIPYPVERLAETFDSDLRALYWGPLLAYFMKGKTFARLQILGSSKESILGVSKSRQGLLTLCNVVLG